jgi:hypothetical protein
VKETDHITASYSRLFLWTVRSDLETMGKGTEFMFARAVCKSAALILWGISKIVALLKPSEKSPDNFT